MVIYDTVAWAYNIVDRFDIVFPNMVLSLNPNHTKYVVIVTYTTYRLSDEVRRINKMTSGNSHLSEQLRVMRSNAVATGETVLG